MNLVSTGARKGTMKGFTLIELLVVIAIIGILSAVVLASLSTARTKGKDASVQESMSSMRAAAEIVYSTNGSGTGYGAMTYSSSCASPSGLFADTASNMSNLVTSVKSNAYSSTAVACGASASAWVFAATLPSGSSNQFCVDSSGAAKPFSGTLAQAVDSSNLKCN